MRFSLNLLRRAEKYNDELLNALLLEYFTINLFLNFFFEWKFPRTAVNSIRIKDIKDICDVLIAFSQLKNY